MIVMAVLLVSCTNKSKHEVSITSHIETEKTMDYSEFSNDLDQIAKYSGIVFPDEAKLLKSYAEKNGGDLLDMLDNGVYVIVSVPKNQISNLYSNIERAGTVNEEEPAQQFFTVGPFNAEEVSNNELCKYYYIISRPEIDGIDDYLEEYLIIETFVYVFDCNDSYSVYLRSYTNIIR